MGAFFKGRRRKAGVVTLLIACVFVAEWVRSDFVLDGLLFRRQSFTGDTSLKYLISANGNIRFVIGRFPGYAGPTEFLWGRSLKTEVGFEQSRFRPEFDWNIQLYGVNWSARCNPSSPLTIVIVPCGWIAIPPTLLSAWLLLSKPRRPKKPAPTLPSEPDHA